MLLRESLIFRTSWFCFVLLIYRYKVGTHAVGKSSNETTSLGELATIICLSLFRRRKAFHDSDSTSSDGSTSGDSDDERRFQRRKAKSMAKQRGRYLELRFHSFKEQYNTFILCEKYVLLLDKKFQRSLEALAMHNCFMFEKRKWT